jgi:hypothetical protein
MDLMDASFMVYDRLMETVVHKNTFDNKRVKI